MSRQPRRQRSSNTPASTKVAKAEAVSERSFDRLRCEGGIDHETRMEWEVRNGMRTGGMVAYCWTCRQVIPDDPHAPPADGAIRRTYFRTFARARGAA